MSRFRTELVGGERVKTAEERSRKSVPDFISLVEAKVNRCDGW